MTNKKRYSEEEYKQRRKESHKKYHEKNPTKAKQWRQEYTNRHPEKRLLWAAKKRAKEQGLPFNIEESDIVIPTLCPYLKVHLVLNAKRGCSRTNVMSLDRKIPELGYVKGNIEVISHLANTMKSNANIEQLTAFATEILRRHTK